MGDPSDLRFVPSSCATTPIDWTKVPEASKKFLLAGWTYYSYESDSEGSGSLPATIGDLAKMLDGSKFFGYMTHSISTLLSDISEFGLAEHCSTKSIGLPVGPRFYMKFLDQIGFVLFVPGYRDGIIGYSPDIPYTDDWNEDAGIARDKALAEDYDAKLCKEVSRIGTAGVASFKEVAGWEGSTLLAIQARMTYHPAPVDMIQGFKNLNLWSR